MELECCRKEGEKGNMIRRGYTEKKMNSDNLYSWHDHQA